MKLEPLKDKKFDTPNNKTVFSEDAITSAVGFYKRYKNNIKRLMEEQKPIWKVFISYYNDSSDFSQENHLEKYNDWLFNYTFSDVLKQHDVW